VEASEAAAETIGRAAAAAAAEGEAEGIAFVSRRSATDSVVLAELDVLSSVILTASAAAVARRAAGAAEDAALCIASASAA
jgi:hypothetical protein